MMEVISISFKTPKNRIYYIHLLFYDKIITQNSYYKFLKFISTSSRNIDQKHVKKNIHYLSIYKLYEQ